MGQGIRQTGRLQVNSGAAWLRYIRDEMGRQEQGGRGGSACTAAGTQGRGASLLTSTLI